MEIWETTMPGTEVTMKERDRNYRRQWETLGTAGDTRKL